MRITRYFTKEGRSPYHTIRFRRASSEIRNPDGSIVFSLDDIEVPETWSPVAGDVLAQKYFRKAGVPAKLKVRNEADVPRWLRRRTADVDQIGDDGDIRARRRRGRNDRYGQQRISRRRDAGRVCRHSREQRCAGACAGDRWR